MIDLLIGVAGTLLILAVVISLIAFRAYRALKDFLGGDFGSCQ